MQCRDWVQLKRKNVYCVSRKPEFTVTEPVTSGLGERVATGRFPRACSPNSLAQTLSLDSLRAPA